MIDTPECWLHSGEQARFPGLKPGRPPVVVGYEFNRVTLCALAVRDCFIARIDDWQSALPDLSALFGRQLVRCATASFSYKLIELCEVCAGLVWTTSLAPRFKWVVALGSGHLRQSRKEMEAFAVLAVTGGYCQSPISVDAIDQVVMNSRLHYLGMAARVIEPVMKLAVLTCMDARIDVAALLGLKAGDAHVIRNAGGRASIDALHSLAISQAVLGTREVMVLHHTECALGRFTESDLANRITAATGHLFTEGLGCFTDPIAAVVEDVERLRTYTGLVHRDKVRGFMYDLAANALTEILLPQSPHP